MVDICPTLSKKFNNINRAREDEELRQHWNKIGKESPRLVGVVQTIANPRFKLPGRDVPNDAHV